MRARMLRVLVLAAGMLWAAGCADTNIDDEDLGQDTEQVLQTCGKAHPTCPPGFYCSGLPRGTCLPINPPTCGRALPCPPGYTCSSDVRGVCYPN